MHFICILGEEKCKPDEKIFRSIVVRLQIVQKHCKVYLQMVVGQIT